MDFGQKLTLYRKRAGLTLRDFSKLVGYDASNISKVERGKLAPPAAGLVLRKWATALSLRTDTHEFTDFVASGLTARVNKHIRTDEEMEVLMPAFFRTVGNKTIDPVTYEKLKALLKQHL